MNPFLDDLKGLLKTLTVEQKTLIKAMAVKAFDAYADLPSFVKKMISPGRLESSIDKFLK